jgi:hypothetical protein
MVSGWLHGWMYDKVYDASGRALVSLVDEILVDPITCLREIKEIYKSSWSADTYYLLGPSA